MSCWLGCWRLPRTPVPSTGPWRWIPPSPVLINTPRTSPATQGVGSNYTNLASEPPEDSIGRSRGGLTSKIHHLADGRGRLLVVLVGGGLAHDGLVLEHLLAHLKVNRCSSRPRTRPRNHLMASPFVKHALAPILRRIDVESFCRCISTSRPPTNPHEKFGVRVRARCGRRPKRCSGRSCSWRHPSIGTGRQSGTRQLAPCAPSG